MFTQEYGGRVAITSLVMLVLLADFVFGAVVSWAVQSRRKGRFSLIYIYSQIFGAFSWVMLHAAMPGGLLSVSDNDYAIMFLVVVVVGIGLVGGALLGSLYSR